MAMDKLTLARFRKMSAEHALALMDRFDMPRAYGVTRKEAESLLAASERVLANAPPEAE